MSGKLKMENGKCNVIQIQGITLTPALTEIIKSWQQEAAEEIRNTLEQASNLILQNWENLPEDKHKESMNILVEISFIRSELKEFVLPVKTEV